MHSEDFSQLQLEVQRDRLAISSMRRVVSNAASMLTSDVVNRATTFILYTLVARYLGAFAFGQMSLALTLFYTFQVFAAAGMRTLLIREISKDKNRTGDYLVNSTVIAICVSIISILALLIFIQVMNYGRETSFAIFLISIGLLPYSLSTICEAVFQAWEKMHYIAYANIPTNIIKIILTISLLSSREGLYFVIIILSASYVLISAIEWLLILRNIVFPRLKIDLNLSLNLFKSSITFLGIDSIIAISSSINIIILSKISNETNVGLYSASNQMLVPLSLIYQNIVLSVFPMMCRRFETNIQGLKQFSEQLIELLLNIALPVIIGLVFLSNSALLLLYGHKDFTLASTVLCIIAWNLILTALTHVLGQVLIASLREKLTLRIVVINAIVSLVFGLILVSQFGLIGAALAAVITKIVDFFQHYIPASKIIPGMELWKSTWKSVGAGLCMAAYLIIMRDQNSILLALSSGIIYICALFILTIWSSGGPRQMKVKYMRILSDWHA